MNSWLIALKFLTIRQRFSHVAIDPQQVGNGASYFPLVGLFLGSVLVLTDRVLTPHLASESLSVVLVAVLALLTGAIHFEGLQGTFDALSGNSGFGRTNESRSGILGLLAVLFVVLLKVRSLEITGEARSLGLLLSPVFARWALVVFIYGGANRAERSAALIAENVRPWHVIFTTALTLVLTGFLIGATALWVGLCVSLFAVVSRSLLGAHGTLRYSHFGAIVELSEALSLIIFSIL